MKVSNKDWIHVKSFILSASPKGLSQDRISEVDTIAGLEPVIDCVYMTRSTYHGSLLTSGTRATSSSRLCKSNNKLSGGIQTTMAYEEFDEATVTYIL